MSRARDLSRFANNQAISIDSSLNVGINSSSPDAKLDVVGVVSATEFYGDGSNLTGVSSPGLGTALSDDTTSPLNSIYFTNANLSVASTITVNPPSSASAAFTQYANIVLQNDADLIVADGDTFIPDILGIGTDVDEPGTLTGGAGKLRVDNITNKAGTGSPNFPFGMVIAGVVTATDGSFSGNVSVGGTLTYEDVTSIDSVGVITARSDISIADKIVHTGDTNTAIRFPAADTFTVETGGSERLRINSSGETILRINSASHQTFRFTTQGSNEAKLIMRDASNNEDIVLNTGGISYFNGGTIGINNASPDTTYKLDVIGAGVFATESNIGSNDFNVGQLTVKNNYDGAGAIIDFRADSNNGTQGVIAKIGGFNTYSGSGYDGALTFSTRNHSASAMVERLRITSTGKCEVYKGTSTTGKTSGSEAFTVGNGGGNHRFAVYPDGTTVIGGTGDIGNNNILLKNDGDVTMRDLTVRTVTSSDQVISNRSGSSVCFRAQDSGTDNLQILANGKIQAGSDYTAGNGVNVFAGGSIYIRQDGATGGVLRIRNGSDYKIELNGNGSATFTGAVKIGGSAAANEMDEYEEGIWTPTVSGASGSTVYRAYYIKVGRKVTVFMNAAITGGNSNGFSVTLPFTAVTSGYTGASQGVEAVGSVMLNNANMPSSTYNLSVYCWSTTASLYASRTGIAWTALQGDQVGSSVLLTATYVSV